MVWGWRRSWHQECIAFTAPIDSLVLMEADARGDHASILPNVKAGHGEKDKPRKVSQVHDQRLNLQELLKEDF